jgi:cysteinyl-tRNA synthetase
MAVRVYNSRTRRMDELQPLSPPTVTIYVCGLTPNSHPHLGHARTFLTFDVLRRHLTARGFAVRFVQNVTDIDDKIIDRAKKDGIPWTDVVARFYGEYDACARRLGLLEPDVAPRATQEISDIVAMIAGLVSKDAAYETGDGVYFKVKSFARYGELSGRQIEELRAGVRFEVREQKNDPLDFALWKKAKPGEPTWESPWGPGRPGWHIECSAMARRYLGDTIDIHGGATDLIFPHHENEVAQTESFTGKHPMAVLWMHAGLLNVDGQKMSKSLGNFVPLVELLDRHSWAAIRYFFLQTGYRKPTNFTDEALEAAKKGLRGLYTDLETLRTAAAGLPARAAGAIDSEEFDALLDDDLNTAGAIGWLQKRLKAERTASIRRDGSPQAAIALAERCLGVLGLPPNATLAGLVTSHADFRLSDEARRSLAAVAGDGHADDRVLIDRVVAMRLDARAAKDFATSDRLRDVLTSAGIILQDAKGETKWSAGAPS